LPEVLTFLSEESGISGLSFPLLEDGSVVANMMLGRPGTLFTWNSGLARFEDEFKQFFPVLGPVGVTLGGRIALEMQFGFGYDTQGMFDFYDDGGTNPDLFLNGFYALAADDQGNPVTGITLEAGITAGIELNVVVASAGVEGDVTATIGMYLDDQLSKGDGKVRGGTLAITPIDEWFYAAGSLSAGLRAYLEIGWPPFGVEFDFESPRVVLLTFDTKADETPVLGSFHESDSELVLNVGDRASFRLYGDLDDRAEELFVGNSGMGGLSVYGFNATNDFPLPSLIVADGNERGDVLVADSAVTVPVHFTGGPGYDKLVGGAGADRLEGGDGPDYLVGNGGDDTLLGGADNDKLNGGSGSNTLNGGPGLDTASWVGALIPVTIDLRTSSFGGAAINDTLISIERYEGTSHDDTLDGSDGPDSLLAGSDGNDVIRGHGGSDLLEGGKGDDTLEGGADDDMLVGGPGADHLDGGTGVDTVSYLGAESPVTVSLLTGLGTRGDALGDVLTNFEILVGSGLPKDPNIPTGDILEGSDNADVIHGMGGADTIHGAGGNDVIYGDNNIIPGDYSEITAELIVGTDNDKLFGDEGDDMLFGQADDDLLDGGAGFDRLDGGTGNDHLITFDLLSIDYLDGGEGTNRLSADYSDKNVPLVFTVGTNNAFVFPDGDTFTNIQTLGTLIGTGTNDIIRLAARQESSYYNKNIDTGPGDDLVVADWRGLYLVSPSGARTADSVNGGDGNDTLSFEQSIGGVTANLATGELGGAAAGMTMSGFENLIGTDYPDVLTGDAGPNIINPLTRGALINTYDSVNGGDGTDILRIDFSRDDLVNEQGVKMGANAGSGYEIIASGPVYDPTAGKILVTHYSIERFEITGGATNDALYGEDVAFSGITNYNDIFFGLGGNDYIDARLGDDYIDGGEGNDTLLAGAGNDTVIGGPGNDYILFDYSDNRFSTYGTDICDAGPGDDLVRDANLLGNDISHTTATTVFKFDGGEGYDTLQVDLGNMTTPFVFDEAHPPAEIVLPNGGYLRNFERLSAVATGSGDDVILLPGRLNSIIATRTGNDIVNPGLGVDTVNGGSGGDDLIILDYSVGDDADAGPVVYNNASSFIRRSLSTGTILDQATVNGFERVRFTGTSKADVIVGYNGSDLILAGSGDDSIAAGSGNDWIDGGPGADTMIGQNGNDTFIVDDPGDVVTETAGTGNGTDTVRASIDYALPASVENLVLTGNAVNGTGNSVANQVTGNTRNNYLRGEGGNDTLNGGGGTREIDRLNGGANADTFVLGEAGVRFYDDGSPNSPGLDGYAIIEDFTPSQGDRLRLAGKASEYLLGASPFAGITGTAVYHDSNGNALLESMSDELIAILMSPETLTTTNTLNNAGSSQSVDPAVIGLTELQPSRTIVGGEEFFVAEFTIFDPMTNGVLLEIQSSSDLGLDDPWRTIASKNGSAAWTGTATVSVSAPADGQATVTITDSQPIDRDPARFYRARISGP
jgi:Ca2+-binding RTX toxin-like protein